MTQQIETIGEFTFIRHEPIQMHATDSVIIHIPRYYFRDGLVAYSCIAGRFLDSVVVRSEKIATARLDIRRPNYFLTALTPYPIWREFLPRPFRWGDINRSECFGYIPSRRVIQCECYVYRAIINGDTITINSPEQFRELFAPVKSVQQAIAFAHIFTRTFPIYNLDFLATQNQDALKQRIIEENKRLLAPNEWRQSIHGTYWEIHQPEISSSFVEVTNNGYKLLLYQRGTQNDWVLVNYSYWRVATPYWKKLIKVTFEGEVVVLETTKAFSEIFVTNQRIS